MSNSEKKRSEQSAASVRDKKRTKGRSRDEIKTEILGYMGSMQGLDNGEDIPKQDVAEACGFQNHGTHSFFYAWQELDKESKLERSKKKGCGRLTEKGLQSIPEEAKVGAPLDNKGKQDFFLDKLKRKVKETSPDKADIIFGLLRDGKPHSPAEILQELGIKSAKTKNYDYFICAMKKGGVAEETSEKMLRLTNKCFPEGRP
jgi:hypothetical protein